MKKKIVISLDNWMHFIFKQVPNSLEPLCDLRDALETGLDYNVLVASRKRNKR